MYSVCLFCQRALGRNEMLEAFPVGRRLAFDAATGRLWVICRRCGRWNLTPLEERWEAIEQAERLFRATRLRVATDNIGLARLRDGTDLVRIGRPQRPEMAAWRYGDQLGRRRRRYIAATVAGVALSRVLDWAMPVFAAASVPGPVVLGGMLAFSVVVRRQRIGVATLPGDTQPLVFRQGDAKHAELVSDMDGDWRLRVRAAHARVAARWWQPRHERVHRTLRGDAAIRAAAVLLPAVNAASGSRADVREAVSILEHGRSPLGVFTDATRELGRRGAVYVRRLGDLSRPVRLALEMASHEEQERRALEGELAELERAWRAAEEVARIADDLLIPAGVRAALARVRRAASGA